MDLLNAVKKPKFGYGRGLNPCLDCRIISLRRASEYMKDAGATFLVTGEILGQRPMSQRREALRIIDRESGLAGRILRPLSAKHLPPTEPELQGLVDRQRLLALSGRSRTPQMELAEAWGINDYPCPAGGCLLTDPILAARLRALLDDYADPSLPQVTLLKAGRHFFSTSGQRIIIPRDDLENRRLLNLRHALALLVESTEFRGPVAGILTAEPPLEQTVQEAAALVARYGQGRDSQAVVVKTYRPDGSGEGTIQASPEIGRRLAETLRRV